MAQFIDWKALLEGFDEAPTEEKERIRVMLLDMPKRLLEDLFEKELYARLLYEQAVGPWIPPVEWTKKLELKLSDVFESTLRKSKLSPNRFWPEYRVELEKIKTLTSEDEMVKTVERLADKIIKRESRPKPKVLPPPPETCPIDGTPLSLLTRIPVKGPVRLTEEEESFRHALHLSPLTGEITWVDVPPTMRVWVCEAPTPHYFERYADGRLVQRTQEFLYKKILRETAKLRKITVPTPTLPRIEPPPTARPTPPTFLTFQRWLRQIKDMYFAEYCKLTDEESKRMLKEYEEWIRNNLKRRFE